jgi:hypothetical protein
MERSNAQTRRLDELAAEAKYADERFRLYRAKMHGSRLTSPRRLRMLEQARNLAEARLHRAR